MEPKVGDTCIECGETVRRVVVDVSGLADDGKITAMECDCANGPTVRE